ncbi:parapinopsin isoform X1 [Maylandia zebra]|uniref:parapinopsin isoform X1 n=1 Tax=Maylandia zebra TaxID=106582 RepID=UPI00403CC694
MKGRSGHTPRAISKPDTHRTLGTLGRFNQNFFFGTLTQLSLHKAANFSTPHKMAETAQRHGYRVGLFKLTWRCLACNISLNPADRHSSRRRTDSESTGTSWLTSVFQRASPPLPLGECDPREPASKDQLMIGIVSLISLSILSYDRYSTLMVYNKRSADYRKPLLAVGGSWLYSVIWTVPPLLGWSSYGLEGAGMSCSVSWTEESPRSHSYIICLFVFCLGLPVLIMVYCYSRLLYAVKQVGRIRRTAARRREFHILFMVITTVVCYLICWMPYGIVAMMATFGQPGLISPVASVIPSILAKTSTVINPVIYILMNKQFYRCFLILFHCKHPLTEDVQSSMPSKTTMVQLNRRVLDGSPARPSGTKPIVQEVEGISAAESDKTDPVELPLPPLPLPEISSS